MKKQTQTIKIDENNISEELFHLPIKILKDGGLVAFPTETVYGLGANAFDEEAVSNIFKAKGRPSDNPLIVHISDVSQLSQLTDEIPKNTKALMDKFWPGPLTLLFKKNQRVPLKTSGGLDTVAVRMPNNAIALKLIELSGLPLAAPSANTSGRPSPTRAEHVLEDLSGEIDAVIDGGSTGIGIESTVLDLSEEIPMILRPGSVTFEELVVFLPNLKYDPAIEIVEENRSPKSPGQKYRHYSPKAKMEIIMGNVEDMVDRINKIYEDYSKKGLRVAIMASDETIKRYNTTNTIISMGSRKNLETISKNLFHVLREFDRLDVDIILSEGVEETGIGKAIMNRMKKAAGENIIYL